MASKTKSWVQIVNLVFLIVGIAALVWMLRKVGWAEVRDMVSSVGWWSIPIMAIGIAGIFLNAAGIHVFMRPEARMVSYWRVLAAQISGQAVNSVTPTGTLGEIVKSTMLMEHAPRYRAVSSIVAYNIVNIFATAFVVLFALAVSIVAIELPNAIELMLQATFVVLLVVTIGAVVVVQRGLVASFATAARGLRIISRERREKVAGLLDDFDRQLRVFGPRRQASYKAGFAFVFVAKALGWFDMWITMYALGSPGGFAFVSIASAGGVIVGSVAAIVPMGVGANEGGLAGMFKLLGESAGLGLAVSLVRRLRTIAIAVVGILVMLGVQLGDHLVYRASKRRIQERAGVDPEAMEQRARDRIAEE